MPIAAVVTMHGTPVPPEDVLRRLRAVDAGLGLAWTGPLNQWKLVRQWPSSDRRWRWVQEQKYDPAQAHDIIGYIPNDCPVDMVPAYVERLVREWPVPDRVKILEGMVRYNAEGRTDAVEAAVAGAIEETVEAVAAPKKGRRKRVTVNKD